MDATFFEHIIWDDTTYPQLTEYFVAVSDARYREFNRKVANTDGHLYGVKVPRLREVAKAICKGDRAGFLRTVKNDSLEELLVQGFVIGFSTKDDFTAAECFLPKIANWAVCDLFCSSLKSVAKRQEAFLPVLDRGFASGEDWKIRFCFVMFLSYYMQPQWTDMIVQRCREYDRESYYVSMAVAWCVSVLFVKFPEAARPLLLPGALLEKTRRRAISKIVDSFRVSSTDKQWVKSLR